MRQAEVRGEQGQVGDWGNWGQVCLQPSPRRCGGPSALHSGSCRGWEWAAGEERVGSPVAGQGQSSKMHRGLVSEARSLFRTSSFSLINRLHQGRGISLVAF